MKPRSLAAAWHLFHWELTKGPISGHFFGPAQVLQPHFLEKRESFMVDHKISDFFQQNCITFNIITCYCIIFNRAKKALGKPLLPAVTFFWQHLAIHEKKTCIQDSHFTPGFAKRLSSTFHLLGLNLHPAAGLDQDQEPCPMLSRIDQKNRKNEGRAKTRVSSAFSNWKSPNCEAAEEGCPNSKRSLRHLPLVVQSTIKTFRLVKSKPHTNHLHQISMLCCLWLSPYIPSWLQAFTKNTSPLGCLSFPKRKRKSKNRNVHLRRSQNGTSPCASSLKEPAWWRSRRWKGPTSEDHGKWLLPQMVVVLWPVWRSFCQWWDGFGPCGV